MSKDMIPDLWTEDDNRKARRAGFVFQPITDARYQIPLWKLSWATAAHFLGAGSPALVEWVERMANNKGVPIFVKGWTVYCALKLSDRLYVPIFVSGYDMYDMYGKPLRQ